MKTSFSFFIVLILIGLSSCKNEQNPIAEIDSIVVPLESIGWPSCQHDHTDDVESRHRFLPGFPAFANANCLLIFVDNNCNNTEWSLAIDVAINKYNAIPNCSINLTKTTIRASADIIVECNNLGGNCSGGLTSIVSGQRLVEVNSNLTDINCFCTLKQTTPPNQSNREYIVIHELGHAFGLGHTDATSLALVPGTPTTETLSLFNSGGNTTAFCSNASNFSAGDILALGSASFYPCDPAMTVNVTLDDECLSLGEFINITSTPSGTSEYSVLLEYDCNGQSQTQLVHSHCGGDPITTLVELYDNACLEGSDVQLLLRQCSGTTVLETFQMMETQNVSSSVQDSYPQLGETVTIQSVELDGHPLGEYLIRLKYNCYGQIQYETVGTSDCNASSSTTNMSVELWDNSCLAYSTVVLEVVQGGTVTYSDSFTIFP